MEKEKDCWARWVESMGRPAEATAQQGARFFKTRGTTWTGFDLSAIPEIARKIRAVYDAIQPPANDPMLDFDERDLLRFAEDAGFHPLHLELEAEIKPSTQIPWEAFIGKAGNPRIPALADAMAQALDEGERTRFEAHLRAAHRAGPRHMADGHDVPPRSEDLRTASIH